ncbi:phospho-sugar mutase [Herbiconiux daphne]|uniref:Phospho-sugar mutase n=1 Tax=Herbiconiux daphne TaxID=2970914 RepID=A0ABT2H4J5_9MICO|nr:phospho-sugar mutase [Herbiconiux daphne]MCS5734847.1 phospho-sugar mutase [Herbiconiux daphne]
MNDVEVLVEQAVAWLNQDPDPETHDELHMLLRRVGASHPDAVADLRSRFGSRLAFGTAGLRGELAAGPNRMNRVLVGQAAAGLAAFLLERAEPGTRPSIVIGYDGRKNSRVFATDTAEIMAGAGVRAILLPRLLPTPLVAFAVRDLGTSAGVMVTASHNPPRDNGYKVYLGDADAGSQIIPPADAEIAAAIDRVAATVELPDVPRSDSYEIADETVVDRYVAVTAAIATPPSPLAELRQSDPPGTGDGHFGATRRAGSLGVVYTAMHGVGWETFARVLDAAGFARPELVSAQIEPDSAFPTVSFPNPEEPGALDLSYEAARAAGADLIIANDPDADRLAIALPDAAFESGYRRLTGNEVGQLLGWRAAEAAQAAGRAASSALACSIVSSPALGVVARAYGLGFAETLTGFKWVSRTPGLVFGYEEALGYLVNPETVRDKDGISAAIAFLSLADELAASGRTVADRLDEFSERFGHYGSVQISLRVSDLAQIAHVMERLRTAPPADLGGVPVERIDDLAQGGAGIPPSDVLRLSLPGARVMVRPSGTEPKLKIYLDAWSTAGGLGERRDAVTETLQRLEGGIRDHIS